MNEKQLNVFLEYTGRFHAIAANLPDLLNLDSTVESRLRVARDRNSSQVQSAIRRYFGLLSEEYYLFKDGYVHEEVWGLWLGQAMKMFLHPVVGEVWISIKGGFRADFRIGIDRARLALTSDSVSS